MTGLLNTASRIPKVRKSGPIPRAVHFVVLIRLISSCKGDQTMRRNIFFSWTLFAFDVSGML